MGKFRDVNCPLCNQPLENGELIVICPDCGAPYHKDCVMKHGKCIYDDLHAAHRSWEMPKKEEKEYSSSENGNRCSRCGTMNPVNGLFCEVCGNPLRSAGHREEGAHYQQEFDSSRYHGNAGYHMGSGAPGGNGFQQPPQQMPYDPFTTPFGGLNPEDTLDDVPMKDAAIFVGQNTQYFLPRFKQFSERNSKMSFNFCAMLFHGFYFFYRKMYLWGALSLLFILIMSVPDTLIGLDMIRTMMDPDSIPWFDSNALLGISNICSFISIIVRVLLGMFANRLYYGHCIDKIRKAKSLDLDHQAYVTRLTKQGSVSMKVIVILLIAYFLLSFAVSFALIPTMFPTMFPY